MSVAWEWSPAEKMQVSTGISSQLLNLVFELGVFAASELFLRSFSVGNGNASSPVNKKILLIIQGSTLLIFSGLLYLYQRIAYILISVSLMIFCRVLWFKRDHSLGNYRVVSKPINRNKTFKSNERVSSNNSQAYTGSNFSSYQEFSQDDRFNVTPELGQNNFTSSLETGVLEKRNTPRKTIVSSGRPPLRERSSNFHNSFLPTPYMSTVNTEEIRVNFEMPSTSPPGLVNRGNTCFVNSVIQCLAWSSKFSNLVCQISQEKIPNDKEAKFINYLSSVISQCRMLPDGRSVLQSIATSDLLDSIAVAPQHLVSSSGTYQCQQDAAEFLHWLLHSLHLVCQSKPDGKSDFLSSPTDLEEHKKTLQGSIGKYKREISEIGSDDLKKLEGPICSLSCVAWELHSLEHSSRINDIFMGQFLEIRQCGTCKKITTTSEYFTVLPLPIEGQTGKATLHLEDCIRRFGDSESLGQDNMVTCTCSPEGSSAARRALLSVIPDCIIFQLTRFDYDSVQRTAIKNSTPVHLDLHLDIDSCSSMKDMFSKNYSGSTHTLQAICAHSGGHVTTSGHYVSYCKASDGRWYYYNDDVVTPIPDIQLELNSLFILQNAYLLFYSES